MKLTSEQICRIVKHLEKALADNPAPEEQRLMADPSRQGWLVDFARAYDSDDALPGSYYELERVHGLLLGVIQSALEYPRL